MFVTIQLGKEKYQTSTIKNARNPEWFEECDLAIPHMHSEIEVQVFHRGMLSDDFLGYATIPLWEQKIMDKPKSQWVQLKGKPSKGQDNKYRGEIEIKVTFHCHSRVEFGTGLKKRSSSIRNLATAVGDKLKFTRSRSLRENRKDPEGSKTDRHHQNHTPLQDVPEPRVYVQKSSNIPTSNGPPPVLPAVSFPALDLDRSWADPNEEGLTRSYSMSAAYVKSMSLDRGRVITLNNNMEQTDDVRSQSLYNIPGSRRSMVELPSSQAPPPYQIRPSSHDDLSLSSRDQAVRPFPQPRMATNPSYLDSVLRRELARYESIRERTEPEESSSSDGEGLVRRRPRPPPRGLRSRQSLEGSSVDQRDSNSQTSTRKPDGGSREGTPVSMEGGEGENHYLEGVKSDRSDTMTNGSLQFERGGLSGSHRKKLSSSGHVYLNGEVKMRKRSKRERLHMYRQAGRRFTVQGLEGRHSGLYDDSLSDPSDSSRTEIMEDLFSTFKNMNKEELLRTVIQNKAQLIRKDQYIKDLENYIDDLLVRVMETQPRILHRPPMQHR